MLLPPKSEVFVALIRSIPDVNLAGIGYVHGFNTRTWENNCNSGKWLIIIIEYKLEITLHSQTH